MVLKKGWTKLQKINNFPHLTSNNFLHLKRYRESAKLREEHEGRTILPAGWRQKSKLPVQDNDHDGDDYADADGNLVRFPKSQEEPDYQWPFSSSFVQKRVSKPGHYHRHHHADLHEADPRSKCAR